jgi:hypothetical protein
MSQRTSKILAYLNQVSEEKFEKISGDPIYQRIESGRSRARTYTCAREILSAFNYRVL